MDIQKDYLCIEQNSRVLCKKLDWDFDFQEAIPAYLDDVYRVVRCNSCAYVASAEINYNEIKVYGKIFISVTYYNENSTLSYADFEESFTKSITAENLSDRAFVFADINNKYTSFRIINQRRIDIHISSVLHIDVYDKCSCPCIKTCTDSRLRAQSVKCADIVNTNITKIEFDEEFSIPSDSPSIKRIVSFDAYADINDIKVIKDKALFKANVNVNVVYSADNDSDELLNTSYSFSISKIAEISGIGENDIIIPMLNLGNVFLKAKNKNGDKLETINVYGDVYINSLIIRENVKELITDAYIVNRMAECTYSNCELLTDGKLINETKQFTQNYTLNSDITQIKELSMNITSYDYKNSSLTLQTEIAALAVNSGGEVISQSATAEAKINLGDSEKGIASVNITSFDYTIGENGNVNIRAALKITAYVYNENDYHLISDIEAVGDTVSSPTVTVYFASKNENVWNIAKQFLSDSDSIIRENELSGDTLENDRIIIIPKA